MLKKADVCEPSFLSFTSLTSFIQKKTGESLISNWPGSTVQANDGGKSWPFVSRNTDEVSIHGEDDEDAVMGRRAATLAYLIPILGLVLLLGLLCCTTGAATGTCRYAPSQADEQRVVACVARYRTSDQRNHPSTLLDQHLQP